MDRGNIVASSFQPPRWLQNRHLQTILPALPWAYTKVPAIRREILILPDGDETAVDWLVPSKPPPPTAPLLLILHGLEGSARSSYARMLMSQAEQLGWHACVMHFRDCGDYCNRLPRRYHAGETNDLRFFLSRLAAIEQVGPIAAVGYSLGGNVLLKYLGEAADATPVCAASAVCVPLDLHRSSAALNKGFSKLYQIYLLIRMKNALRRKFNPQTAAFNWDKAMAARTFGEFDDVVTAPLHGFRGVDDYYDKSSAMNFLRAIQRPTLIINAKDDPFMTPEVIPTPDVLSGYVRLEVSDFGGHVGFIDGGTPWRPRFYLPERITGFLRPFLD
jgi:predicted alpha/beta-fold hydrolase